MKKIIRLSLYMAAVIFATSCLKEVGGDDPQQPQEAAREVTLNALALKTAIGDNTDLGKLPIVWEGGDMIAMAFEHSTNGNRAVAELISDIEEGCTEKSSKFKGQIDDEVFRGDYNEVGFAVYPSTAVSEAGEIDFTLPPVQTAREDGSFGKGINLLSTAVNLSQLGTPDYGVTFHNALSFLRFKFTSDVKSVTFEGTSPFTGKAPLKFDMSETGDGRLLIDTDAEWKDEDKNNTFTLKPADGKETFDKGVIYNVLVWPGDHTQLTMTLDVEGYKECVKVSSPTKPIKLEASKFYTITLNDEKLIVTELNNDLDGVIGTLGDINGELDEIEKLLSQIQSVSLVSEYLDNAVKARYSVVGSDYFKQEIELNYMIRPANVAMQLVDKYSDSMSALVSCRNSSGGLDWVTLPINSATFSGDIMTVKVNADAISKSVYDGNVQAQLALQIASSTTDILSDFATLHPFKGAGLYFTKTEDIPVIKGASLAIPFRYAPSGNDYTLSVSGNQNPTLTDNKGFFSGYINVNIADSDLASQSLTVRLTSGDDVVETQLTFAQGPQFEILDIPQIDWIGGQFSINVNADWAAYNQYSLRVEGGTHNNEYNYYTWIKEASVGVSGIYSVEENVTITQDKLDEKGDVVYTDNHVPVKVTLHSGTQRQATAVFEVKIKDTGSNGDLSYRMTRPIIQKAYGTSYNPDLYYQDAKGLTLQTALPGYTPLNIVILGDGYKKKDLIKGGLFESRARSAMGSFFGIEPYKSYQNRFNVYMVAYESAEEGTDSKNEGIVKNTYFNTYHSGETQLWFGDGGVDKVKEAVTEVLRLDLYRTISIVLVNTDKNAGTSSQIDLVVDDTSYYGEPYKGFGVACVAANSTGTNGLVKHEAGGHAFGRLADEYLDGDDNIQKSYDGNLTDPHNKGQYRNVTTYKGYWDDLLSYPGYSSVISYVEGGLSCDKGIYRPTTGGMMFNNQGVFNAVCRRIIYERIIRQTEGAGAYSLSKFVEYDTINMPK